MYTNLDINVAYMADGDYRKIIRIAISPKAKDVVEKFADKFDMKEMGVASRMYEWFGKQPEDVQLWVLGLVGGRESHGMQMFANTLLASIKTPILPAEGESPTGHIEHGRDVSDAAHRDAMKKPGSRKKKS